MREIHRHVLQIVDPGAADTDGLFAHERWYVLSIPTTSQIPSFRRALTEWYRHAHRKLPWRETSDPYRVWLSEIMLQQTRVAAALPYYQRFLERFPTVDTLASAPEQDLLAAWSGLGYYSRARNMQRSAREIVKQGGFPRDHEGILRLPGIGDYTAAAIASICFDLPYAVVDGNVLRVISRLTNDAGDIQSTVVRRRMKQEADALLDARQPSVFNQAMMELGALVCLPKSPQCLLCPVREFCQASAAGTEADLPVKLRRTEPVAIEKVLLLIESDGALVLWQRGEDSSRMAGFWELPEREHLPEARLTGPPVGTVRHSITHHRYTFTVQRACVTALPEGFEWVRRDALDERPLSTIARKALRLVS
ncbi:MAG: A/G-specific adenine glycosylase [Bryobacteraceae bacterium]